jgi:hypothetical protein
MAGADEVIPKSRVLEWMRSPDLDVRGALYSMIINSERASRAARSVSTRVACAFVIRRPDAFDEFLIKCLVFNA